MQYNIPPNLLTPLQQLGYEPDLQNKLAYANGVATQISGRLQENVITGDIQQGLTNVGLTDDDLRDFLYQLEDNLKATKSINPDLQSSQIDSYRCLYLAFFLEVVKHFAVDVRYRTPDQLVTLVHQRTAGANGAQAPQQTAQILLQVIDVEPIDKKSFALSMKNPQGIGEPHICPRIYLYNYRGKARMFLHMENLTSYNEKMGAGLLKKLTNPKNRIILIVGGISIIALTVASVIIVIKLKKRHDEKHEEQLAEIEEEIAGDIE